MKFNPLIQFMALFFIFSCATKETQGPVSTSDFSHLSLKVHREVLDNGLTVLLYQNNRLPIISYYTLFDVGGRSETKGVTGATHFLEHMMFKGAKKYGPGQFDTLIEKNGGSTNAYTTTDFTVYYQSIPSHFLEQMIDLEADRIQNLLLEPISFESERQVVFEERKMRYENSPDGLLYLSMMKKAFEGTPYGQSVIGEVEDLKALNRDQMLKFFKTYYRPNNAILAIAGDLDVEKTMKWIKEKYGPISKSVDIEGLKKISDDPKNFETKAKFNQEYLIKSTNPNPKFMYTFKGVKSGEHQAYVLDLLANILGGGASSYLYTKYVQNEKPTLISIGASNYNLIHSGIFYFSGEMLEGANFHEFKKTFKDDFYQICDKAITERALMKAKNQIQASGFEHLKSNAGIASTIMMNEKVYKDYNRGIKDLAIYLSISLNEVKSACKKFVANDQAILVSVGSQFNEEVK